MFEHHPSLSGKEVNSTCVLCLEYDGQEFGKDHVHTFQTTRKLADAHIHCGRYVEAQNLLITALKERNIRGIKTDLRDDSHLV